MVRYHDCLCFKFPFAHLGYPNSGHSQTSVCCISHLKKKSIPSNIPAIFTTTSPMVDSSDYPPEN